MSDKSCNKNRKNKGFTLAELLIVVSITIVLACFGFVEIAANQRKLKRTEMDNIAREIFVAAQNHLTASKLNGNWVNGYYNIDTKPETSTNQNKITYAISDYPENETQSEHEYYYVLYDKQEQLLTNPKSVLTQFLPYGSLDDSIRTSGSYIIEFDASTASIYGVFYTEGTFNVNDLSTYNSLRNDTTGRTNYKSDENRMIFGYYGGAVAQKQQSKELNSPTVEIHNDDLEDSDTKNDKVLEAVITDPNVDRKTKLQVTIRQISSTLSTKNTATFTIDLSDVIQGGNYYNNTITCSDGSTNITNLNKNTVWYPEYTSGGIKYHIYLDNILGENTKFTDLFNNIPAGSDIEVQASIIDVEGSSAIVYASANTNANFASLTMVDTLNQPTTSETGIYEATISSPRHLANLATGVSKYDTNNSSFSIISANLTTDVNWKDYAGNNKKFVSIQNNDLKEFKGNDHTLKDFDLLESGNDVGLFGTVNNFAVKDLYLVDFKCDEQKKDTVGTLIGSASNTTIENVHIYVSNKDLYNTYQMKVSHSTGGGLVGTVSGTTTISNSSASIMLVTDQQAQPTVGGLIGTIDNGTVTISDCYTGGMVTGTGLEYNLDSKDDANIQCKQNGISGGLIGEITSSTVTITDSYTTASVYGGNNGAGASGGIIGEIGNGGNVTFANVYAAGCVKGEEKVTGTFIGSISNKGSFQVQNNTYAYVLDLVANKYVTKSIGGDVTTDKIVTISAKDLTNLSTKTTIAIPYHTELGTAYPYPSNNDKHYGDWEYPSVDTAFVYYEKYSDSSYQYHGYRDELTNPLSNDATHHLVEVGNGSFPVSSTVSIVEEGYIFSIPNSFFDKKYDMWNHEQMDATKAIRICFNGVLNSGYEEVSLESRIAKGEIVDVTDTIGRTLGYTQQHVYKVVFDNLSGNYWSDDYAKIDIAIAQNGRYDSIGKYYISRYYADSVKSSTDNITRKVRTASQLLRILNDQGRYTLNNYASDKIITQELDIDLSGYTGTLSEFGGKMIYEGTLFENEQRYTRISGLTNTFVKSMNGGTIRKIEFSIQANNLTTEQISNNNNNGYGLFISSMGNGSVLDNVKFVDCSINNTTFDGISNVGVIANVGYGTTVKNCSFENITLSGNTIVNGNTNFGVIANTDGTIQNTTFHNITISNNDFNGQYFGVIGNLGYNATIDQCTFDTIDLVNNQVTATSVGIVANMQGKIQGTAESKTTISNIHIYNNANNKTITCNALGVICNMGYESVLDYVDISNVTFEKLSVISPYWGVVVNGDGTVRNTKISDITIQNINSSSITGKDSYGYGVIVKNRILDQVEICNVNINNNQLPGDNSYLGIITLLNQNGYSTNVSIHDIQMDASSFSGDTLAVVTDLNQPTTSMAISNIKMKNLGVNGNICGIVGKISSSVEGLNIDGVELFATNTATINVNHLGIIASINNNNQEIKNVVIGSEEKNNYIHDIVGNVKSFGVVSENVNGKIQNLTIQNTTIEKMNFSVGTKDSNNEYVYGVVGTNYGSINNILLKNVTVNNMILPILDESKKMYVGVIAHNCDGDITGSETQSENITFNQMKELNVATSQLDDTIPFENYGFIGVNEAINRPAMISGLKVMNYDVSDNKTLVYKNNSKDQYYAIAKIENSSINEIEITY